MYACMHACKYVCMYACIHVMCVFNAGAMYVCSCVYVHDM